jgi:hypothetical protein
MRLSILALLFVSSLGFAAPGNLECDAVIAGKPGLKVSITKGDATVIEVVDHRPVSPSEHPFSRLHFTNLRSQGGSTNINVKTVGTTTKYSAWRLTFDSGDTVVYLNLDVSFARSTQDSFGGTSYPATLKVAQSYRGVADDDDIWALKGKARCYAK